MTEGENIEARTKRGNAKTARGKTPQSERKKNAH